jgi:hypothetical protein
MGLYRQVSEPVSLSRDELLIASFDVDKNPEEAHEVAYKEAATHDNRVKSLKGVIAALREARAVYGTSGVYSDRIGSQDTIRFENGRNYSIDPVTLEIVTIETPTEKDYRKGERQARGLLRKLKVKSKLPEIFQGIRSLPLDFDIKI